MNERYALLLRTQRDLITRCWVDEIYASAQTQLADRLSYRQLIDHLPALLDELGGTLDSATNTYEISEAAQRVRYFMHVRFQQGCRIDEVARELSVLREVINDFLWSEIHAPTERDWRDLQAGLKLTNTFFDELIRQTIVVYAASLRPPVPTYASIRQPTRQRFRAVNSSSRSARER